MYIQTHTHKNWCRDQYLYIHIHAEVYTHVIIRVIKCILYKCNGIVYNCDKTYHLSLNFGIVNYNTIVTSYVTGIGEE